MKIAILGSTNYKSLHRVVETLFCLKQNYTEKVAIVTAHVRCGVEYQAYYTAERLGLDCILYKNNYTFYKNDEKTHNFTAQDIADACDMVIFFWSGNNKDFGDYRKALELTENVKPVIWVFE